MSWENELLSWDPNKFCLIESIIINGDDLWKPDLYIYEQTDAEDKSPVVPYFSILHNGTTLNSKPLRIASFCQLDIYRFPFDVQSCSISFGSYVHTVKDIMMIPKSDTATVFNMSQKHFKSTGEWTLVDITVNVTSTKTDADYSVVKYTITLKREPDIYIITFIIPACLMILLDLVSFFIYMETGERLGFKITILLGFSVLLLILSNVLPTSNNSPLLGIFCLVCMSAMVLSLICSVAISHMLMLSESQPNVPPWVKVWFLTYLAKILCFRSFAKYGIDMGIPKSKMEMYSNDMAIQMNMQRKGNTESLPEDGLEVKLQKMLLFQLHKIRQDLVDFKNKQGIKTEWHAVALVVDRLALAIYLVIVISLSAVLLIVWLS